MHTSFLTYAFKLVVVFHEELEVLIRHIDLRADQAFKKVHHDSDSERERECEGEPGIALRLK